MNKILKFITSEFFLVILLSIVSLSAGMFPTMYRYLVTPKDRVFVGTEFYSDDYSIYVSNIFQGMNGRWTLLDKHTSEPHERTIIHDEYLLWGKLTGIFGLHQVLSYHLARLALGAVFLVVAYFFLLHLFPENATLRKLSFSLLILSGGFPILNNNPDPFSKWHLSWLSEIDVIARTTVLPHYLLGYIFFLTSALFLLKSFQKSNKSILYLFTAMFSGTLLALVHPVNLVTFDTTILIYLILLFFHKFLQNRTLNIKTLFLYNILPTIYIVAYLILTAPTLLYYRSQFNVIPWNHMQQWENITSFYPTLANIKEYALALGPTFFLGLLGIIFFCGEAGKMFLLGQKQFLRPTSANEKYILFLISWLLAFFTLFYFSYPILHISQVRFMQNPIFIPFSILSALTIIQGVQLLNDKFSTRISSKLLVFSLTFLVLISIPTYYYSLQAKLHLFSDFSTLIYPTKGQIEAIEWLKENTDREDVVLSSYEAGTLIPFWSGNTIYAGHLWATLNWPEKSKKAGIFYSGQLSEENARKFLTENRIKYVFYGFQEQSIGGHIENYSFLKPVFQNQVSTIFKVKIPQ